MMPPASSAGIAVPTDQHGGRGAGAPCVKPEHTRIKPAAAVGTRRSDSARTGGARECATCEPGDGHQNSFEQGDGGQDGRQGHNDHGKDEA
jgi:hypothetical protein